MRYTGKFTLHNLIGWVALIALFGLLNLSLGIRLSNWISLNITWSQIGIDFLSSLVRVIVATTAGWITGIIIGAFLHYRPAFFKIFLPLLNFMRNISPFAWLPFAIILFGIGELPLFIVLYITLFIPTIFSVLKTFDSIPPSIIEAAQLAGAPDICIVKKILLPMLSSNFIHILRIMLGLGWSTLIAVEMLGVKMGLGYRILDYRYLFQTAEMLVYIIIIGSTGVLLDYLLHKIEHYLRKRYPSY